MNYYIFIDESGHISTSNTDTVFVLGSFATNEYINIEKKIKSWFYNKYLKKFRSQSEIKWSSDIKEDLRLKTLKYIRNLNIDISYAYLTKKDIYKHYSKNKKIYTEKLYIDLLINLLKQYNLENKINIYIYCDRWRLKNMTINQFKESIKLKLSDICKIGTIINIEMIDSTTSLSIQVADWIAGAMYRFLNKGHLWCEIGDIFNLPYPKP